jgi:hypothetical protein
MNQKERLSVYNRIVKRARFLPGGGNTTPYEIAVKELSVITDEELKNPDFTFIDCCAGIGTYGLAMTDRLLAFHTEEYIINKMIYLAEIDPVKVVTLKGRLQFKNVYHGDTLETDLTQMIKNDEFDLAAYNPPYGTGQNPLHLIFLEKMDKMAKRQLVLHPGTFLLRPEYGGKEGGDVWLREKRVDDIITENKSSFTWLNGSEIFDGADFTYPIVITDIDKTKPNDQVYEIYDTVSEKTFVFNSTKDVNMLSDSSAYFSVRDKIRAATEESGTNFSTIPEMAVQGDKKWSVQYSGARGNKTSKGYKGYYNPDFFTIIPADKVPNDKVAEKKYQEWRTIWFDTEEEALNFIEYLKTYFFRFCLGLNKTSRDIMNRHVKWCPWLGDYKTKWTDELLFEKFNITKEEQTIIYDSLPDYYGIAKGNR